MRADDQLFNINRFSRRTLRQGKAMTENQVSYFFSKLSNACHSRFSSHRYRHTVATELMQKPEQNLYVTQKLLDHRDIKVTLSYIEHNVEMLRSCVERDWQNREWVKRSGPRRYKQKKPEMRPFCSCRQRPASLYNVLIVVDFPITIIVFGAKAGLEFHI